MGFPRANGKSMNVEPAMVERVGLVLKSNSLTRERHLAVDIEPVLFVFGCKCSHPLSTSIMQPGMVHKRMIYFVELVIDWRARAIEFHLNNAEPCINGIKEGAIPVVT